MKAKISEKNKWLIRGKIMKKVLVILAVLLVIVVIPPIVVAQATCPCPALAEFCYNTDGDACRASPAGCMQPPWDGEYCVPGCTCDCTDGGDPSGCVCPTDEVVAAEKIYVPGFNIYGALYLFMMFTGLYLLIQIPPHVRGGSRRSQK